MNKFLNVRIGREFYEILMTQPCFQTNWKAISPCFYFLQRIADLNNMNDGEPVEFYSGEIANIFQPYTGGAYAEFLSALEILGILHIDHHYQSSEDKSGHCKQYKVTDYGCRLIHSSNMEYLKKLKTDPVTKRRNQKNISRRKVMAKTYDNPVLDYLYDGLKNISFDRDQAEAAFEIGLWSNAQRANVSSGLCSFAEKSFDELKIGDDGRIHHEVVQLKSDARVLLKYKNMSYRAVLDIRSCHPTFFSSYIISNPITLHYVTDKVDKSVIINEEHQKWVSLFCDPIHDPKDIIKKACGFEDKETAKAAINQSLNGSKGFPKYLNWLKKEFPILYDMWRQTDVKDTGNAIARQYERPLMLNEGLYNYASHLKIEKVMPEHDGLGVFARDDDEELPNKLKSLAEYIQGCSIKEFGVPIVIKIKMVRDWTCDIHHMLMQHHIEQLEREYVKVRPQMDRLQRKYFASGCNSQIGQQFFDAKEREGQLLLRYKDVLYYWLEREQNGLN